MEVRGLGRVSLALLLSSVPAAEVSGQSDVEALPEVTVAISQSSCPMEPSADARALIVRASSGLAEGVSNATIEVTAQRLIRDVLVENVGRRPIPDEVQTVESGSTAFGRNTWMERLRDGAFAVPLELSSLSGVFEAWEYPELWGRLAYYLFSTEFQESHDFGFLGPERDVVVFCAKARAETHIDGRIVLDDASSIVTIDWSFTTPDPDESAGGRAEFGPDPSALPWRGVFWRKRAFGDYTEWSNRYRSWSVGGAS